MVAQIAHLRCMSFFSTVLAGWISRVQPLFCEQKQRWPVGYVSNTWKSNESFCFVFGKRSRWWCCKKVFWCRRRRCRRNEVLAGSVRRFSQSEVRILVGGVKLAYTCKLRLRTQHKDPKERGGIKTVGVTRWKGSASLRKRRS